RGLDFRLASPGEGGPGLAPVADVAVGHGDELDLVSLGRPHRADARGLQLAIVRVRAEADDAKRFVGGNGNGSAQNNDGGPDDASHEEPPGLIRGEWCGAVILSADLQSRKKG